MVIDRFDVYLVNLDPTIGSEIKKTRPSVVISPNEMNHHINTVIIAPMTTKSRRYPTRIDFKFQGRQGQIVLDQIRTVDKRRMIKKIGRLDSKTQIKMLATLIEMFSP
ncbi:MAG: type II toxin-antitoxin system PemK/MazF family toxin [Acidobacteria bacterium]|nr:type II toxin-antitoxin system PemK/MazF family toxin [Acidobacteriota bacterium]